jgi:hypothetical protein
LPPKRSVVAWLVLGVYAVAAGLGFAVGYSQAEGSADDRLTVGVVGAVCGFVAVWFVALWGSVGRAVRQFARPASAPPSSIPAPPQAKVRTENDHVADFDWPTGDSYADRYRVEKPRIVALRRQAWATGLIFVASFVSFLIVPAGYDTAEGLLLVASLISLLWLPVAFVRLVQYDHRIGRRLPAGMSEAEMERQKSKRVRNRYVPRARTLALTGVAGILVASFVLDPLSNSDRVSTRLGDLIFFVSGIVGYGGILLLIAAPVCFLWRR